MNRFDPIASVLWFMVAFLIAAFLFATHAGAFPDSSRLGYQTCAGCHVSPSGGGVLKPYGRSAGEEFATWAPEGSGRILGIVPDQNIAMVGGDVRYAVVSHAEDYNFESITDDMKANKKAFPMQIEGELAIQPVDHLWIVGSLGYYGPDLERQLRRNYAMLSFDIFVAQLYARAGRFTPSYGINLADHTAATRQGIGLGDGSEKIGGEFTAVTSLGELTLGENFSGDVEGHVDGEHGYTLYGGRAEWSMRLAVTKIKDVTFGGSAWRRSLTNVAGFFVSASLGRELHLLAESDRSTVRSTGEHSDTSYVESGWEIFRGFQIIGTAEYEESGRYGGGLRWIPVPHYETIARVKKQDGIWSALWMAHAWL